MVLLEARVVGEVPAGWVGLWWLRGHAGLRLEAQAAR